jgi:hypothetical protein
MKPFRDEELRFVVHDSPDYYSLKLSVFNDDRKADLIGEGWVDLKEVIVPGGGQSDLWQQLECRKKYAGEVRIELTYYDSRPKVEKPAPKRVSTRDMQMDSDGLSGPRELAPVKRRPLPGNPGSGASSLSEQQRLHATGPRKYGILPAHRSNDRVSVGHRRDTVSTANTQSFNHDDKYYGHEQENSYASQFHDSYHPQPDTNDFSNLHIDDHHERYESYDQQRHSNGSEHYNDNIPFRQISNSEHSPLSYDNRYDTEPQHPQLHHSYSAPDPEEFHQHHQIPPLRHSMTEDNSQYYHDSHDWDDGNPFGPDHPASFAEDRRPSYSFQDDSSLPTGASYDQSVERYSGPVRNHDFGHNFHDDEPPPPPPPPTHRYAITNTHSSPGYGRAESNWDSSQFTDETDQWPPPKRGIYGGKGHLASRSEICLPSFHNRRQPHSNNHENYDQEHSHNYGFDNVRPGEHYNMPRRSSSPQRQIQHGHYSTSDYEEHPDPSRNPYDFRQPWEDVNDDYPQRQAQQQNGYDHERDQISHQKSSSMNYLPLESPSPRSSPQSLAGSLQHNQHTPSRPHPLSQQQNLSSSPHYASSPYEGMPLIKPLAISPNKHKLSTPKSQDRYHRSQGRSPTTRKSVSPQPLSGGPNSSFGTPYSPDSFDTLNPTVSPQSVAPRAEPTKNHRHSSYHSNTQDAIVDFHGNVVDPSDRLPETSWAPEPEPKDPSDHLPSSSWAPEPLSSRSDPRKIKVQVRVRDRVSGSRDLAQIQTYGSNSSPAHRGNTYSSSPLTSSPVEASPSARNRLVKKSLSRPRSMAPLSSWSQPIRDVPQPPLANSSPNGYSHTSGPLISAKIPLDSAKSSPNYGVKFTNSPVDNGPPYDDPFSISGINVGTGGGVMPRRIGGRRLLGFGG